MDQNKYNLEFTIYVFDATLDVLKEALKDLGKDIDLKEQEETDGRRKIVRVHIRTDDPYIVFDACSQFGRLKSVKVGEAN